MSDARIASSLKEQFKKVTKKLTDRHYEEFKKAGNEETRLQLLYTYIDDIEIKANKYEKDYGEAQALQQVGNNLFKVKCNDKAIATYSTGIRICPQKTDKEKELHAILVANRSAVLFEKENYPECLIDIDYALSTASYPDRLLHKLLLRKMKCFINMQQQPFTKIVEISQTIEDSLIKSDLSEPLLLKKKQEIQTLLKGAEGSCAKHQIESDKDSNFLKVHVPNPYFLRAHGSVSVVADDTHGRYAYANANIDAGTVIVREQAYCAVVDAHSRLTNCQHCLKSTALSIACPQCATVIFCSLACKDAALRSYHRYECGLQANLFEIGASVNCLMALRLVTQNTVRYLHEQLANRKRPTRYDPSDYRHVYELCCNPESRTDADWYQYTLMALYLLKMLRTTAYFADCANDAKEEMFVGRLLLHHLQIVEFNGHEIAELQPDEVDACADVFNRQNFQSKGIGGGIYPTAALFNHSCDPCVLRLHVGTEMVVRTLKPVKAGEPIFENYGPLFMSTAKTERQQQLKERYKFDCECQACLEDWPLYKDMNNDIITVPCSNRKCNQVFYLMENMFEPLVKCSSCRKETNVLVNLAQLKKLDDILNTGEALYQKSKYSEAEKQFLEAVDIFTKYTTPPLPDCIKALQRLRSCMLIRGNKSIAYCNTFGH